MMGKSMLKYDTKKWTHVVTTVEKWGGTLVTQTMPKPTVNIPTVNMPTVNIVEK